MTFSNQNSSWYKPKKENNEWPPKYWKFLLSITEDPKCEIAFTDLRRLGRIRLVDCEADHIRKHSPLKENGPDPVIDKEKLSKAWFVEKIKKKRVPVKAWLLDQSNISGVGNWVG
jgi:formamidopyrimidine-DNA glycosylase